jgi:hypothetical protein
VAMNAEAKRGNRCSLSLRVRQPIGERLFVTLWNSFLKTGFPAAVEFEFRFRSARFGFHQPRGPFYLVQFFWLICSSLIYFHHLLLKIGFSEELEFEHPFRNARFEFRRPTCPCYLAFSRSACSGSFRFCLHLLTLTTDSSVEPEFGCRLRSAHSDFPPRTVPSPVQHSLP